MNSKTLRRIVPFVVLTVVFAGLLYRAEHKAETGISSVNRHITEVTSPCLRYGPGSRQCKRSFEAALATLTHPEACAVERKAGTLAAVRALALALRQLGLDVSFSEPCAGARLAQERQRTNERGSAQRRSESPTATAPPEAGDANSAPTGHSLPGRHEGGSSGGGTRELAPGDGGHKKSPENLSPPTAGESGAAAPAPTAPTSPGTSSSSTTERTTETTVVEGAPAPEAPVRQGAGAVLESVGGVVEETGGQVNEVVGGVTETTCSLAKLLCTE